MLALASVLAGVAACGSDDGTDAQGAASRPTVVIELVAFQPDVLEVQVGESVSWDNQDVGAHTVISGTVEQGSAGVIQEPDGRFASEDLDQGARFEHTFDEAGTYPYFCSLHPATMRGEVRVI